MRVIFILKFSLLGASQHTAHKKPGNIQVLLLLLSRRPNKENFKMKIILVLSVVSLTIVSASPQFGFLGQLFGGGRNRGRGRQNNRPSGGNGGGGGGGRCGGGNQPNH